MKFLFLMFTLTAFYIYLAYSCGINPNICIQENGTCYNSTLTGRCCQGTCLYTNSTIIGVCINTTQVN